ncbi:polymorphic toxin-type HINT domain-containing protein [Streptomyces sp. NPDC056638]|uniref:polymorphic toxin-type HINT domain-containing protein n=1 Tax=Streptomyces sp. NPDC056638 TaxID=3345887 RepID=UPI003687F14C
MRHTARFAFRNKVRRRTSLAVSAVLVATLLQAAAAPVSTAAVSNLPGLPKAEEPVAGSKGVKVKPRKRTPGPKVPSRAPRTKLPEPTEATIAVPEAGAKGAKRFAVPKGQPIGIGRAQGKAAVKSQGAPGSRTPSGVTSRILSRQQAERAGVNGALFTLVPKASDSGAEEEPIALTVDYSAFAELFGGSYASRMQLIELPACALTTPDEKQCRSGRPVAATNNTAEHTLTAKSVSLQAGSPTVLAAAASAAGDKGDYKATPLAASSTWRTNLNTGDFTWSYDIDTPEVPGGLKPNVGLSYSSGAIDGRTGGTNNQGSWVGDGFDLWPGFIERRYKPCADDGVKNADGSKPGDMCWAYDNAFISFNGSGGELVPAGKDEFKMKHDDGTRIKRLESADRGNGDNDGEYWELTAPDGTRYYFGYNRLPGWSTGKDTTDSTWTLPVYGNNTGEKCHAATFADSWCQQAWRWNLDYVVDTHGNAVSYHYTKETNSYGRNLKADDDTEYTRGGSLKHIDYGQKSNDLYAAKPLAQVVFGSAERCLPESGVTCAADTIDTKSFYWYDTPWDLNCKAGTTCDKGRLSPSFWTRKRLTDITTQMLKSDGTYGKVDSWKFDHRWGMADTDYQLLLDSMQHTGESATPTITLPKTTFAYEQLANRLDKTGDGFAPFIKSRLSDVADEYGGQISANYSDPVCDWNSLPTPETNTTRCFPQYIGGSDSDPATQHWFNKYVSTSVTATDRIGGAPDQVTRYDYLGNAAWHFDDDDGLTKEKEKTWSQWRGYGQVRVRTGGQGGDAAMKTQQDSYFLRGMDGDRKNEAGGTKAISVALATGEGDPITDHESSAGYGYKTVTFDKPGGKVLSKSVNRPWHHETAKKVRDWGTVTANFTGTSNTKEWVSLDDGAGTRWRTTSTAVERDTVAGRVIQVDDFGDDVTAADDQCTRTTYPEVTGANILNLPTRVETVTKACDATTDRSKDVVSDVRTAYDGGAYGAAPIKGDTSAVATLKSHDGTKATYLESGATYDAYGRQLKTTDLVADVTVTGTGTPVRTVRNDGRTTTTTYTPATGQATEIKVTTPPANPADTASAQTKVTTVDPVRGVAVKETDTNSNVTELAYDALGRSTKVWLADRRNTQVPSQEFVYTVADKTVAVAAKTLNNSGSQVTSYALYDGFLRNRQTQTPGPDGGSVITDVFYDERGLAAKAFAPYYTTDKPSTQIFKPADALSVETQTRTTFDGLNRAVETQQIAGNGDGGKVLNTTKTIFGGDRTTVIPPDGGTATTTLTDARGNTTELRQHHSRSADAAYDTTTYHYTPRGELDKATDPGGNSWSYEYDQLGRQTVAKDPDKGTTNSTYDDRGQLTFVKGSRTDVPGLAYLYDNLGRQTEVREKTATGTLRTKQVYDTITGAKGQLAESTRYVDGQAYTSKVTAYDRLYRPFKTAVVIPAAEGNLQGTYQTGTSYLPSGLTGAISYSAAGSLPGGSSNYTYEDETLRPITVFGEGMTSSVSYSLTGKPLQYTMGLTTGGKKTQVTNTYEWGTQRLANSRVDRQDQPGVDRNVTYQYDEAGNVLSMADVSRTGTDNQCFINDYLGRVTEAWTQSTTTCAEVPSGSQIGGPAPYWQSFTYDKSGNRSTEIQHNTAGDTTKDTKRNYSYPDPGQPKAHSLTSVTTQAPSGTTTNDYVYDPSGNNTTRPGQDLTWDAEGHLATVTENGKTTTYLYDATGNRLISRTSTEATLYLGNTEVTLPTGADKAKATRYFDLGGGQTAIRQDNGTFSFTIADHHGTGELAIQATDLALTQRRTLPFGAIRGQTPTAWPSTKGFVGGTDDTKTTGLTHLGAREYDPDLGRFISVDPVLDLTDPQQMNGYTYSNNNPATHSDPTGLWIDDGTGHSEPRDDGPTGTRSPTPGKSGNTAPTTNKGGPGPLTDLGNGAPRGFPSTKDVKLFTGKAGDVSTLLKQAKGWGYYSPQISDELNVELYLRERCSFSFVDGCAEFRKFYDGWKHLDRIPTLDTCPMCTNIGFAAILSGITGGRIKSAGGCKCFLAGTQVLMSNGKHKSIEVIDVGDEVIATDPETGETEARKVTRLITTDSDKKFNELTIETPDGNKKLTATHEHPFWSPSEHRWIEAGQLRAGMTLRSADGSSLLVKANRSFIKHARTYNLTVDGLHTYYVLAGETPVLVHNSGPCGPAKGAAGEARAVQELQDRGYTIMGTHVKLEAKDGTISYVDVVATRNGPGLGAPEYFEVKNGPSARLSPQQKTVYGQLGDSGRVILRSDQMGSWGLKSGDLLPRADVNMILYGGAKVW